MLTIPSTLDQRIEELKANAMPGYWGTEINAQNQISNVSAVITNPYDPTTAPPAVWWQWVNSQTWDTFISNGIAGAGNWVTPGGWGGSWLWLYGWNTDIVFTAASQTQVNRAAGDINMPDGTVYNIGSGNTGAMSGSTLYYVYLDITISTTALQVTTTSADAVWTGKVMVCVAQRNSVSGKLATFQAFGNKGTGIFITADNIAANTITANEIAANTITASQIAVWTITADRMNVTSLSAITANIWTVTSGNINGLTITWWTIQTATSWQRVVITWSNNDITFYNSSGNDCWNIRWTTTSSVRAITVWDWSNTQLVRLWATAWILLDGWVAVFSNTSILWWANNTYDLWSSATRWRELYLWTGITLSSGATITWHLLPDSNNTYDLWSNSSQRWRCIYLWNGSWTWLNLAQTVTSHWTPLSANRSVDIVINWTTYKLLLNI